MKVPKYIQAKMHRLARLSSETAQLSLEIDEYFRCRGYNVDNPEYKKSLRCDNGESLKELELGNDITENFVNKFERGEYDLYSPCLIGDTVYFIAHIIDAWKIVQGKVINFKTNYSNKSAISKGTITVQCENYYANHPKSSEYTPVDIIYFL